MSIKTGLCPVWHTENMSESDGLSLLLLAATTQGDSVTLMCKKGIEQSNERKRQRLQAGKQCTDCNCIIISDDDFSQTRDAHLDMSLLTSDYAQFEGGMLERAEELENLKKRLENAMQEKQKAHSMLASLHHSHTKFISENKQKFELLQIEMSKTRMQRDEALLKVEYMKQNSFNEIQGYQRLQEGILMQMREDIKEIQNSDEKKGFINHQLSQKTNALNIDVTALKRTVQMLQFRVSELSKGFSEVQMSLEKISFGKAALRVKAKMSS